VYPVMLDAAGVDALVVGGGPVAARKARALIDSGARVRVVARAACAELAAMAMTAASLTLSEKSYEHSDMDAATLVIAATDDAALNAAIAARARERGRLVNVVDAPELGTFMTPAVHRAGDVVVAVSAGGVPTAARRIRDAIAHRIDARFADAIAQLGLLRRALLDAGQRDRWREAADALTGADFAQHVESGHFAERVAQWR
jgi:siroheme synthase-like protein